MAGLKRSVSALRLRGVFLALVMMLGFVMTAHGEGGDLIWAGAMGSQHSYSHPRDISVDAQGNSYTLGKCGDEVDLDPGPGTVLTSIPQYKDGLFLLKLDAAGHYVWSKTWTQSQLDFKSYSIAIDPEGNIVIAGSFVGTWDADPGPGTSNLTHTSGDSACILKLNAAGEFVWAKAFGQDVDSDLNENVGLAVDSNGNIYFTAFFLEASDFDPGAGTTILTPTATASTFLVKFDSMGNLGWAKLLDGYRRYSTDRALCLATDSEDHILVLHTFEETLDSDPGPDTVEFEAGDSIASCLVALDASGNFLWSKAFVGDWEVLAKSLCVGVDGSIYLVGAYRGSADFDPGPGVLQYTTAYVSLDHSFIVRLDASGNLTWATHLDSHDYRGDSFGRVEATDAAVDASGNVYVVGQYWQDIRLAESVVLGGSQSEIMMGEPLKTRYFALKFSSAGNFRWAENVRGNNYSGSRQSVAVSPDGHVLVANQFEGEQDFDPGPETLILAHGPFQDCAIVKMDGSDRTSPRPTSTVSLTTTASNPTTLTAIPVTATFSTSVTGFEVSDLVITNATATNFSGDGSTFTFTLVPNATGPITATVPSGVAIDNRGAVTLAGSPLSLTYDPDPHTDSDGDGVPDATEVQLGTNPDQVDSDGDRLSDGAEVGWDGNNQVYTPGADTNPLDPDTDGDGVSDGVEAETGHNPLLPTDVPTLPLAAWGGVLAMLLAVLACARRVART